ncbi:hypothetical protein BC343_13500 [Mucilaginibacter pedocola]|uniref:Uncharacterized protein n=2 Tax=Mucilaginibacter pedocola TaxID=1792845 RepID=A0A1S9PAG9_9SPHI|nr:hypothetical protein BC343_13500 [Mucilaginibacter pedocola]
MFRDAGMDPTEHPMNKEEMQIVAKAFAVLPPLHQRVLEQHLRSISFLDNMPNTALTSPVTKDEGTDLFHITFRAGILHQTISEWATEKERTCFEKGDSTTSVSIHAGLMSALTYVLLHESTHVVDGSTGLLKVDTIEGKPKPNAFTLNFTNGVWQSANVHDRLYQDPLLLQSRFRPGGRRFVPAEALTVYAALAKTPFASLYSMASWHEDLAELLTIYHLTEKYKQPFRVSVSCKGREIAHYEPMRSALVRQRIKVLQRFYSKKA